MAELDPQDRGLQRIKTAVAAHHIVAVLDLLPVVGNHSNLLGKRRISGKQCPTVAHAAQILRREEARATDGPEGAEREAAAVA